MICVEIYDKKTGKPRKGARVRLGFNSITRMGMTDSAYTDQSGKAYFNTEPAYSGEVYVNGSTIQKGRITPNMKFFV